MSTMSPINNHIAALNRAYAHVDNAIDACKTMAEYTAVLAQIESQCEVPYVDMLYQHAAEIIAVRSRALNNSLN